MLLAGVVVTCALLFPPHTYADSFIWKISDGQRELMLGGTVHLLSKSDYPLPADFDRAYQAAAAIVFETDIGKLNSLEFQQSSIQKLMYTDGTTLQSKMSDATWRKLVDYLEPIGLPIEAVNSMKPGLLASMLTVTELQRIGIDRAGVDEHYNQMAEKDHKKIMELETADEQVNFVASMGEDDVDNLLNTTLDDIEKLPGMMEDLMHAWRQGDDEKMAEFLVRELQQKYPTVYQSLLVTRNNLWLPKIVDMLGTEEVEFILVGAAHLVGKDGLLTLLEKEGFSVEEY